MASAIIRGKSGPRHEVDSAQDKGLTSARHIEGGMAAWTRAGRSGGDGNAEASRISILT